MITRNPDGVLLTVPDPGHPPTCAAWKAAAILQEMFEQSGVRCSGGAFTECLATIVDCHAGLPELLAAAAAAWDLCAAVLADGGAPRNEFTKVKEQLREALDRCGVVTVTAEEMARPQ